MSSPTDPQESLEEARGSRSGSGPRRLRGPTLSVVVVVVIVIVIVIVIVVVRVRVRVRSAQPFEATADMRE